jgi:hypothetical protein
MPKLFLQQRHCPLRGEVAMMLRRALQQGLQQVLGILTATYRSSRTGRISQSPRIVRMLEIPDPVIDTLPTHLKHLGNCCYRLAAPSL